MDRFRNYKDLCRHAAEGRDFIIEMRRGGNALAVMAPHGGGIEPGTDTLAGAIAGSEHGYYAFKGVRAGNNADLHIASERFDEPRALALARQVRTVVTIHGCRGRRAEVFIGGLAEGLKIVVLETLISAGFKAGGAPDPSLGGTHRSNLCNRGQSGKGVQLELSEQLRHRLMDGGRHLSPGSDQFRSFVAAVRMALAQSIKA